MRKLNQKGFHAVALILIVAIVAAVGGTGYYVYHSNNKTNKTSDSQGTTTGAKTNPTITLTPDPTAGWKTYTNEREGFSLKYPGYASFIESDTSSPYLLKVEIIQPQTLPTDEIYIYTQAAYNKDLATLKKGDSSFRLGSSEPASYKLLKLNKGYGKKYTSFTSLNYATHEDFSRYANIYPLEGAPNSPYVIRISSTILPSDKQAITIKKANPDFFKKCEGGQAECYQIKDYELFDDLYAAMEAGKTDVLSQQWFKDFDTMLSTFKFN